MKHLKKIVARTIRSARASMGSEQRQGDEARSRGDWAKAATHYRQHLARNRADFGIWVQLGHALKEAGRYDESEAAYKSAHALDNANSDLFLSRGHLAKLRGDRLTATDFYNRSFCVDGNPDAARELALVNTSDSSGAFYTSSDGELHNIGALEALHDGILVGWVAPPHHAYHHAEVEILLDETVIAIAPGVIERPDLKKAGLTRRPSGFRIDLSGQLDLTEEPLLSARLRESGQALAGSPLKVELSAQARAWIARHSDLSPAALTAVKLRIADEALPHRLSVVVSTHGATKDNLTALFDSLICQWSENWEIVCVHQAGSNPKVEKLLTAKSKTPQIRVISATDDSTVSQLNLGLAAATGDYLVLVRPDTVLEPEAVYQILNAARAAPDAIYWDEAVIGRSLASVERFITRPAFSPDRAARAATSLGSLALHRKLLAEIQGLDESPTGAIDLDFALRTIEACASVSHVPAPLMRTRERAVVETAAEQSPSARSEAIERHLERRQAMAAPASKSGRCLIVITADDNLANLRKCIDAVLASTVRQQADLLVVGNETLNKAVRTHLDHMSGHFVLWLSKVGVSRAQAINEAVAQHGVDYEHLALLSTALAPKASEWLEPLCASLSRSDVGAITPLLVDHTGVIQSAGLVLGVGDLAHSHHGVPLMTGSHRSAGWQDALRILHAQSAADHCIVLRRALFEQIGGLDWSIEPDFEDIDLCLRLGELGYAILVDPGTPVRIGTLKPRKQPVGQFAIRWSQRLAETDPHDSPLRDDESVALGLFWPPRLRPVAPPLAPPESARCRLASDTMGLVAENSAKP